MFIRILSTLYMELKLLNKETQFHGAEVENDIFSIYAYRNNRQGKILDCQVNLAKCPFNNVSCYIIATSSVVQRVLTLCSSSQFRSWIRQ